MKNDLFERTLITHVHRQPFIPLIVKLTNGKQIVVDPPAVAFDREGGVFLSEENGLFPFQCEQVERIEVFTPESVR